VVENVKYVRSAILLNKGSKFITRRKKKTLWIKKFEGPEKVTRGG
jgi:hypothetical protein